MTRALALALALVACNPPTPVPPDAAPTHDASLDAGGAGWTFEVLSDQMVVEMTTSERVELVRANRPDGRHSYVLYVHALTPNAPLVVSNQPYAGIDWTGEPIDARWAAGGDGPHPDVDAPAYDGDDVIDYAATTIQAAVDNCVVWSVNGMACMQAFARFYAGGSVVDDALDSEAPYQLALSRSTEIDLARIGAWGGSWGGMMTLQGAARAPNGARPRVVVALSPPSDFVDLATWTDRDLPAVYPRPTDVEAFFSPYWRRIAPDLGRMPTLASASPFYQPEGLCPMLAQDTWVLHDDWDTLIPVRQSEALAAACPAHVRPIFWRRQTPTDFSVIGLDHGAFGREEVVPSSLSFTMAAIVGTLLPPTATSWIGVVHVPSLEVFLTTVHDEQRASGDTTYAIAPLLALADPRAQLLDPGDGSVTPAGDAVATAVNAVWGTTFDAAGIRAQLATGLPSP